MPTSSYASLNEQLAATPKAGALARWTLDCLFAAAAQPDADLKTLVASRLAVHGLAQSDADTPPGNVQNALLLVAQSSPPSPVLAVLAARALIEAPPGGIDAEDATARRVLQLATLYGIDVMGAMDELGPDRAGAMWGAIADAVQRHDLDGTGLTHAEALVAAALLGASGHETARERRGQMSPVRSAVLGRVLGLRGAGQEAAEMTLSGELSPAPRGPFSTVLLAVCGWLLVSHVTRLIARFALQYRRPVALRLTSKGVVLTSSTRLLGKVMRESESIVPMEGLVRASREVRFPRAAMYAGLVALGVGSYLGVSWFVDGVRASSLSLAAAGLLVMALGIAVDFVLLSLLPGRQGKVRLVLVPKRGAVTCVAGLDASSADAMLRALSGR